MASSASLAALWATHLSTRSISAILAGRQWAGARLLGRDGVLLLTILGVIALMMALIPVVAILPILLYIGMLIGAQAFQETPHNHAPAIILAVVPQIAAWGKVQLDSALGAAGTNAAALGYDQLAKSSVLYHDLSVLGSGATLAGVILGSITVLIIDCKLTHAAAFAAAGAILTFFGLIHGEAIGFGSSPEVAASYVAVAAILYVCARRASFAPLAAHHAPPFSEPARHPHTDTTEGLGTSASSRGRTRSAGKDLKESD